MVRGEMRGFASCLSQLRFLRKFAAVMGLSLLFFLLSQGCNLIKTFKQEIYQFIFQDVTNPLKILLFLCEVSICPSVKTQKRNIISFECLIFLNSLYGSWDILNYWLIFRLKVIRR